MIDVGETKKPNSHQKRMKRDKSGREQSGRFYLFLNGEIDYC